VTENLLKVGRLGVRLDPEGVWVVAQANTHAQAKPGKVGTGKLMIFNLTFVLRLVSHRLPGHPLCVYLSQALGNRELKGSWYQWAQGPWRKPLAWA
jgi:hypothetical protein